MSFKTLTPVTDVDGNNYNVTSIGNQIWMAENLKTTRYSDGTLIPLVNTTGTWNALTVTSKAYCWYNDNTSNKDIYGAYYTWSAVMNTSSGSTSNPSGVQGVCPTGWHLPSNSEWDELMTYLGVAGGKLKESGTAHWLSPNTGATNEASYTALPAGWRFIDGAFAESGRVAWWWSSTEWSINYAWFYSVISGNQDMTSGSYNKWLGLSVRCIKD